MKRSVTLYLEDILEAIHRIEESTKGLTKSEFKQNVDIIDATLRRIEIIGEAVKKIPIALRKKHSTIEWKQIAGTRDILIHAYFAVDNDQIWNVIKKELEPLKAEVAKMKNELAK